MGVANSYEDIQTKVFHKDNYKIVKIGRNKDNQISLEGYAFSRIHTTFIFNEEEDEWYLKDGYENKASTNGTWIYLDWPWKIEDYVSFRIGANFLRITKIPN